MVVEEPLDDVTSKSTTSSPGTCCDRRARTRRRSRRRARASAPGAALADALASRGVATALLPVDDTPLAAPIVVVDSYTRRADDRSWITAPIVVALDDLERDLAVDCVIDPSLGATGSAHRRARRVLAGPRYAPLVGSRADVRAAPIGPCAGRVLVTMGGADASGIGTRIAAMLVAAEPWMHVRLVLGPWGARTVPRHIVAVEAPDGLEQELAAADVVVTAGGVTLLESLALGRPTVVIETAPNQHANVVAAENMSAAVVAAAADAADAVRALAHDEVRRQSLHESARALVDFEGAARVADVIVELAEATA
jgi:spore coat polysaccharide biosynthesis predicted glycosyltransferase SpsG